MGCMMSHRMLRSIGLSLAMAIALACFARMVIAQAAATKSIAGTVVTADDKPAQTHVQLFSLKPKAVGPTPRGKDDSPTGDKTVGMQDPIPLQRMNDKPVKET